MDPRPYLNVTKRIDRPIDVNDVFVIETAHDMHYCIALANICKKLVAETFTLAGTPDESCDVDDLHRGGNDLLGLDERAELGEPRVGHRHNAGVRLDGAKGGTSTATKPNHLGDESSQDITDRRNNGKLETREPPMLLLGAAGTRTPCQTSRC